MAVGRYFASREGRPLPLAGYSYGGLIGMLAAVSAPDAFRCVISLWGVSSLDKLPGFVHFALDESMTPAERKQALDRRSALVASRSIGVPLLLLHGRRDSAATNEEVELISANVRSNGARSECVIYDDDTHGLHPHVADYHRALAAFLTRLS